MMRLPDDIWLKVVRDEPELIRRRLSILSPEEQDRLQSFAHKSRRTSFVLGRAAARLLVSDRLEKPLEDVRLRVSPGGAVDVEDSNLCLSISHSRNMAAVAIAERAVGVDVEFMRAPHPKLHERILSQGEREMVERLPVPFDQGTLLVWTLKEAIVKALRTGLRRPMKSVEVEIDFPDRRAMVHGVEGQWEALFAFIDGYLLSLAYRTDEGKRVADEIAPIEDALSA